MAFDKKNPTIRQKGESIPAYAAFKEYLIERRIPTAYDNFLLHNPDALTTIKGFISWSSKYEWNARAILHDVMEEIELRRQTRAVGTANSRTAESVSKELMEVCLDEFALRKDNMTPSEIAKFLKIGVDVNDRWVINDQPQVVVNVDSSPATVEISDEVLRELGKQLASDTDEPKT